VTEQVGEVGGIAISCWGALHSSYKQHLGPMSATEIMRATGMGRSEVLFGLRELASTGWCERAVVEQDGAVVEKWAVVERQPQRRGDRDQAAAE
jgi:hypothetical protein